MQSRTTLVDQVEREAGMQFTVTGVRPFTVTGIGREGEYLIVRNGHHPQLRDAFCYRDKKYNFYLYVRYRADEARYTLSVWYVSSQLFAGVPPAIDVADAEYLESNIKHYLENVDRSSVDKVEPPNPVPVITFDWRIGR